MDTEMTLPLSMPLMSGFVLQREKNITANNFVAHQLQQAMSYCRGPCPCQQQLALSALSALFEN